ncbi:hypothetical protein B0H67DRAFT_301214 [Lasiosphaeris hirsuta]|uniref:Uncharacterized protein n=1 Tax=Lasiosphaeris hirsuta TaxID=260670 RepID=A0AA40A9K0_9PEZI|nr:hypothetical protein B0H67DRAFT_301214 [Lasiosphaeris hirsuta]
MGSVVSIEQNENIGLLTWMTIAYLPLSLAVALFSVQHEVLPDYFGSGEFLGFLFGFLVITFIIALFLGRIRRRLRAIRSAVLNSCASTWSSAKKPFVKKYLGKSPEVGSDGSRVQDTTHQWVNLRIIAKHGGAHKLADEEVAQPNGR